jgi:aspartyl-tRNA(Asn)/glutamyl-tRNA(Gln) amidotransferase subunit C
MSSPPSSPLDRRELKHLADLARLDPSFEESERLEGELREILAYVESLESLAPPDPADSPRPSATPPLRRDEPRPSLPRERALAGAPERVGDLFGVRRVIG